MLVVVLGTNCIEIGLPGKSILRDFFQVNMTSRRPFLLTENQFSGKTYFYTIHPCAAHGLLSVQRRVGRVAELFAAEAGLIGQDAQEGGVGARSGGIVRAPTSEDRKSPENGV